MKRKQLQLLMVVLLFSLPLLAAIIAGTTGWRPAGTRAHGILLDPPVALSAAQLLTEDGSVLPWRNAKSAWHLVLIAPSSCDSRCTAMVDTVHRVWRGLNRHAQRVEVHFFGEPDAAAREAMKAFPQMHVTRFEPNLMQSARRYHPPPTAGADPSAMAYVAPSIGLDEVSTTPSPRFDLQHTAQQRLDALARERDGTCQLGNTTARDGVEPAVGLPVVLIDPNGYLVMCFEPGFDPTGLRRDLYRLVR